MTTNVKATQHSTDTTKTPRQIVPYIRRDDLSWWAGARYADQGLFESHLRETSCLTRWGAKRTARRLAKRARRLRERNLVGFRVDV